MKNIVKVAAISIAIVASALGQQKPRATTSKFHISGTVVDATSGEPVQAAEVAIASTSDRLAVRAMVTQEDGRFDFESVTPGKYSLTAVARRFNYQGLDEHEGYFTGVAVGPGLDSVGIVFRLKPEGSIRGRIVDDYGEPVGSARVMLFYDGLVEGRSGAHAADETTTDELGDFRFSHLPAGNYKIAAVGQPWYADGTHRGSELDVAYGLTYFAGVVEPGEATAIVVRPGERAEADFSLHAVHTVHVPVSGDQFATRITEQVFDRAEDAALLNVNGDPNSKTIALAPGNYVAHLYGGADSADKWRAENLNVTDDTGLDLSKAPKSPKISAALHFADAATKADGITLELRNFDNGEIRAGQADAKGEVQFDSPYLRAGSYYVMLRARGLHIAGITASGATLDGRSIEIPESGAARLDVTLARGMGRVDGVALREGKPFAGAMVLLVPENPAGNYILFRRDQSDSDGTFSLPLVVPGKYTAVAIADGFDLEWSNPEVIKRYLSAGTKVEVATSPLKIQVKVQQK